MVAMDSAKPPRIVEVLAGAGQEVGRKTFGESRWARKEEMAWVQVNQDQLPDFHTASFLEGT